MTQTKPRTEQGQKFLLALRDLMKQHGVDAIVGWDTGDCWINFVDESIKEPVEFQLNIEGLDQL